jgi:hypothetical protein
MIKMEDCRRSSWSVLEYYSVFLLDTQEDHGVLSQGNTVE